MQPETLARQRTAVVIAAFLLAAVAVSPALAYVVVLKDGTQISTAKKYELDGERVILTMPNGTQTSYTAAEIDFDRTEEINREGSLSQAKVIETVQEVDRPQAEDPSETSLSDLLGGRALALPDPAKRAAGAADEGPSYPHTDAGFVDFMRLEREPLPDAEVADALATYLGGQGHESARVFVGTAEGRPFLLLRAASEANVFDCLRDAANALVQMNERFPERVQALDLLIATDNEIRAGQFTLTPEKADLLVSGRLEPPQFFIRFVEF